ncbi:MAG TPA: hypothetical protein VLA21_03220 [Candidatus Limnocylindria bacterium]|nr:hypothetical protein [Candidatus Limnocylindria bacterium]
MADGNPTRRERFRQLWRKADFLGKTTLVLLLVSAVMMVALWVIALVTWNGTLFFASLFIIFISIGVFAVFSGPLGAEDLLFMIWWDMGKRKGK